MVTRLATTSKKADDILKKVKGVELQMVGEYMKSLDTSAEETEEKLKERILSIQRKYKAAEGRFEYGEDEIYREKLKIRATCLLITKSLIFRQS